MSWGTGDLPMLSRWLVRQEESAQEEACDQGVFSHKGHLSVKVGLALPLSLRSI